MSHKLPNQPPVPVDIVLNPHGVTVSWFFWNLHCRCGLSNAFHQGQQLFEEDPVCGMALLMFDQTNVTCHCQHCMKYVEEGTGGWALAATQRPFVILCMHVN